MLRKRAGAPAGVDQREEQGLSAARLTVPDVEGMELEIADADAGRAKTVAATAQRWGRYRIAARVEVIARGGLLTGTGVVDAAEVIVFPLTPPQATPIPQIELLDRLGAHLTRHVGPGVEYADIRPYVPGDQLRAVNWPVSARRGQLHVTERLTDRAADVVVLIDGYRQPAGPATVATERVVRGAAQVVQTALRHGDRAGIVALGGNRPRWLGADIGQRQFYRVLDTVLGAGDRFERTTGTLAPRAAVPAGAIVIAFSTLLDTEFALALIDLRRRGHVVLAMDILDCSPFEDDQDPLVDRMWALQRSSMYRDMATVGVDIVSWRGERPRAVDGCAARSPPPGAREAAWIAVVRARWVGWARPRSRPGSVCSWWDRRPGARTVSPWPRGWRPWFRWVRGRYSGSPQRLPCCWRS